jgi:hypothetical protein
VALLVPAVLAVGALLLLTGRYGAPDPAPQGNVHDATSSAMLDLDNVPGFGRSDSAAMRDETIAHYEAWQRDLMQQRCMEAAGLRFTVRLDWPFGAHRDTARYLGIEIDPGATVQMTAYEPDTSRRSRVQTRCYHRAQRRLPGIWELERKLSGKLLRAETTHARASATFARSRGPFDQCVTELVGHPVRGIAQLEELPVEGPTEMAHLERCFEAWDAAQAQARAEATALFIARHQEQLTAQIRRYEGMLDTIANDEAFIRLLRRALERG